jgi:hypothetical protein
MPENLSGNKSGYNLKWKVSEIERLMNEEM